MIAHLMSQHEDQYKDQQQNKLAAKNASQRNRQSKQTEQQRNEANVKRNTNRIDKKQRMEARRESRKHACQEARDAYWADKPYYTSRDEFIELCREATLTESRTEEMRAQWVKHRGADVSAQTCITYMLSPLN